jgi:quercetin dioxygenase-like cupin family protein
MKKTEIETGNSKICYGKAENLAALVAYAEGSVVSRTLVDKPVGTITLFAFDKDQCLSEHSAPYDAVVQVIDGKGEVMIAGKPHTVIAGEMIIMPANVPHSVKAVQKFKMLLTMIRHKEEV